MNQKGFYNENKEWSKKLKGFFKESGFYILIVAGLCILAVGAVYFTTNHLITSPEDEPEELVQDQDHNKEIVILDDETDLNEESAIDQLQNPDRRWDYQATNDTPDDNGDLTAEIPEDEPEVETVAKPTIAPTTAPTMPKKAEAETGEDTKEVINLFAGKPSFIMPVEGKIAMDYAMDKLLYSKTLDEWRVHTGIDIEAARGEVVKAAADGYIKEIKEDPCYGITITLDHENGYKSIYSNLASSSMVSVNQKVKAGDAISSVGNTAIFECMDPPHLHYEVYRDDKLIDPKTLLPVSKE